MLIHLLCRMVIRKKDMKRRTLLDLITNTQICNRKRCMKTVRRIHIQIMEEEKKTLTSGAAVEGVLWDRDLWSSPNWPSISCRNTSKNRKTTTTSKHKYKIFKMKCYCSLLFCFLCAYVCLYLAASMARRYVSLSVGRIMLVLLSFALWFVQKKKTGTNKLQD